MSLTGSTCKACVREGAVKYAALNTRRVRSRFGGQVRALDGADLLLRRIGLAGLAADVLDHLHGSIFGCLSFLGPLDLMIDRMNQKTLIMQILKSVPRGNGGVRCSAVAGIECRGPQVGTLASSNDVGQHCPEGTAVKELTTPNERQAIALRLPRDHDISQRQAGRLVHCPAVDTQYRCGGEAGRQTAREPKSGRVGRGRQCQWC